MRQGILSFNVESEAELEMINAVAADLNRRAPVALRVNPDVAAGGHKYISTGKSENKFGVGLDRAFEVYKAASQMSPHPGARSADAHRLAKSPRPEPFAAGGEEGRARRGGVEARVRDRVFQRRRRAWGLFIKSSLQSGQVVVVGPGGRANPSPSLTVEQYAAAIVPALAPFGTADFIGTGPGSWWATRGCC